MTSPVGDIELLSELSGHDNVILRIAWSQNGQRLATTSVDRTIRIWDTSDARLDKVGLIEPVLRGHGHGVNEVAWLPGDRLVSCSFDTNIRIWDLKRGETIHIMKDHLADVSSVAVSPDGRTIASGSADHSIRLWSADTWELRKVLTRHTANVYRVAWSPDGTRLASCAKDGEVILWNAGSWQEEKVWQFSSSGGRGRPTSVFWSRDGKYLGAGTFAGTTKVCSPLQPGNHEWVLEGHTDLVRSGTFSHDDRVLATSSCDDTVRIWRTDGFAEVARISEPTSKYWPQGIAFHPSLPVLATFGGCDRTVRIWRLNLDGLLGTRGVKNRYYRNAKVVLVGDAGVGKTALANALTGKEYEKTDSTHARRVVKLLERKVDTDSGPEERELLLWDLGGQPNYRLLNQLCLQDTRVVVLVFDSKSEKDPLDGVRFWDGALRQAMTAQSSAQLSPVSRLLVAARTDRGSPRLSQSELDVAIKRYGPDGYYSTSAQRGDGIAALRQAIEDCVDWASISQVASTELFESIKEHLKSEKAKGRLLAKSDELFEGLRQSHRTLLDGNPVESKGAFERCVDALESANLIRRLAVGSWILLQPELLDAYASALVNHVNSETTLGFCRESDAREGKFKVDDGVRVKNRGQELLLVGAAIAELLGREIAYQEDTQDGSFLVFPSETRRSMSEVADIKGTEVTYEFEGPVTAIYCRLAVRLSRSGIFSQPKLGKDGASYGVNGAVGRCAMALTRVAEERGALALFFEGNPPELARFQFREFVLDHLRRRALPGSVRVLEVIFCPDADCGRQIPAEQMEIRRKRGEKTFVCGYCGGHFPFAEARMTELHPLDAAADEGRKRDVARQILADKRAAKEYDVFLCHNSMNKPAVKDIGRRLKERGLLPWLDEWELRPGLPWQDLLEQEITRIKAAAVLVGADGLGPWQDVEQRAFVAQFVKRGCPVIPVVLPDVVAPPALPLFLSGNTWVDFRSRDPDPLERLVWGVTGQRPDW